MPARILSTLGMKCPRPLFEVHKSIRQIGAGEQIQVTADDPAFRPDIEAWCRRTGHVLVSMENEGQNIVAVIERTGE